MKFHFSDQPHQAAAISAVVDLFEGTLTPPSSALAGQAAGAGGHDGYILDRNVLAERLRAVTAAQSSVPEQGRLELLTIDDLHDEHRDFPNFSVEMETGTGKTFVYIETALQLAQVHDLRKFVILVHSVAIRAGVIKTFEQTRDYLSAKFPGLDYSCSELGEGGLGDFLDPSSTVRFLVVGIQSIDKPNSAVVYQAPDQPQLWGETQTQMYQLADLRPIVIIDEPQNFATDLRKRAIATLNPLVALRYSATHRESYNLVHRLGPKQATEAGLVKRVGVKGVVAGSSGVPYLRFDRLRSKNKRLYAEIRIDTKNGRSDVVLQNGDNLIEDHAATEIYSGLVVDRFERQPDRIFFTSGKTMTVGDEDGVERLAVWEDQVRFTIRAHIERERQIAQTGEQIKVLSLFFVEHVADYYGDGAPLPQLFDRVYREEWEHAGYASAECPNPAALRVHYFPSTKSGIYKDADGNSAEAAEQQARAYAEIIANKELILVKSNPRAFIFSHSALREGWDNPNVFQVGFLRSSNSEVERRQQIGRGLRLPRNEDGDLVTDPTVCRLTLVVDETFAEFRDALNAEYTANGERGDGAEPEDIDNRLIVERRPEKFESAEFDELWKRIRYRAHYRVTLDSTVLPASVAASDKLEDLLYINRRANIVQAAELVYDEAGKVITADAVVSEDRGARLALVGRRLPDLVRLVEDQLLAAKFPLQLTRRTVTAILAAIPSKYQDRAIDDPERWAHIVANLVRTTVVEEMAKYITYQADPKDEWWNAEVVFLESEERLESPVDAEQGVTPTRVGSTNLFSCLIYDSKIEKRFAERLENEDKVKLYTKLPRRFRVRTPVGEYSPDWAIVYDESGSDRLYLVRETKDTMNLDDLEWSEKMRILFARKHFAAAPAGAVDYSETTDVEGIRINRP